MRKTGGTLGVIGTDWVERGKAAGGVRGPFRLRLTGFCGEARAEEIGMPLT